MFSITGRLNGAAAGSAIAIALCLIANPAAAEPGKLAGAEYLDTDVHVSSSKKGTKPREREPRIVVKQLVVHPPVVSRQNQNRSGRK